MSVATFLLPALADLGGKPSDAPMLARMLARGDRMPAGQAGRTAQWQRYFDVLPRGAVSEAALARSLDADDAARSGWLRCDPAHVRADGSLLRLMGWGERLQPHPDEVSALLVDLRPLFGDFGVPLSAPHPARWYAAVAYPDALPAMSPPAHALGEDVLEHLPQGREGARWRQLWNECQIILHQHPVNRAREAQGLPVINTLWFWGGGRLPDSVRSAHRQLLSDDPVLVALARLAGVSRPQATQVDWSQTALIDLFAIRELSAIETGLVPELRERLRRGECGRVDLDFADGARFQIEHRQRFRWWRRSPGWNWV